MNKRRHHFILLAVLLLWPLLEASWGQPPGLPKAFTPQVVRELAQKIDDGANAEILKVPYFCSRRQHPCPHEQGLKIVAEIIENERAGTKRWLLLKNVYAFGCFRIRTHPVKDGVLTYKDIFALEYGQLDAGRTMALRRAMIDFLGSISRGRTQLGPELLEARDILFRITELYLSHEEFGTQEINVASAVKKLGGRDKLLAKVDAFCQSQKKLSYAGLTRAALLCKPLNPKRCLEYLKKAKLKLREEDVENVSRYYRHYVDVLIALKRFDNAIAVQRELMKRTGGGRCRLISLLRKKGDEKSLASELSLLEFVTVDEKELKRAVRELVLEQASDLAKRLLVEYLGAERHRDVGHELWARYTAASIFLSEKKTEKAEKLLVINQPRGSLDSAMARMYASRIRRLLAQTLGTEAKRRNYD